MKSSARSRNQRVGLRDPLRGLALRYGYGAASILLAFELGSVGCKAAGGNGEVKAPLRDAASDMDAVALSDALEAAIDQGPVSDADRAFAHQKGEAIADDGSASYALARARLSGRLAESRGLKAIHLVKDAERWAERSIERDKGFRDGEARRMLGTLWVAASSYVEHGDSESGLSMLEALAAEFPSPKTELRLAQAYAALGDPESAQGPLCKALASKDALGGEDSRLLAQLIEDAGGRAALGCP